MSANHTPTSQEAIKSKASINLTSKPKRLRRRPLRSPITPREAAVQQFALWLKNPGNIETSAERVLKQVCWEHRDRALFQELLFGAVRQQGYIKWLIEQLSPRRLSCGPKAYAATALGVYQLLFLDRTPTYAVVDAAVEMARKAEGPVVAGWTNAVLRALDRQREANNLPLPKSRDRIYNLAVQHSHPLWLVQRWNRFMEIEELEKFLNWNNRRPKVCLRINSLKTTLVKALEQLAAVNIKAEPISALPGFIQLHRPGELNQIDLFNSAALIAQDVSQGLVACLVAPQDRESILDMCSAPGGKTGHLAELGPNCDIAATDKSAERLAMVIELIERAGYSKVRVVSFQDVLQSKQTYDAVLVDAPCTGTGTLARRPDLRWRLGPDDFPRLAAVQLQLLRYAAERTCKSGRIIYATCSIDPVENQEVVDRFLADNSSFRVSDKAGFVPDSLLNSNYALDLRGYEINGDGVYAIALEHWK